MWTPRRIVMLSVGFVAFFTVYLGYAYTAVGRIDGLPPLPEMYWPKPAGHGELIRQDPGRRSRLLASIRQAFGEGCPEADRPIRLALPAKNMVLTAGAFRLADGRVCLTPVSVAMFGKDDNITTMRADVAWITFDRPVETLNEISSRKMSEVELNGEIKIVNNRRRKERDQDLDVVIVNGPLFYREDTRKIWTNSVVHLTDHRGKPKPHTVTGKGLEMELQTETPPAKAGVRKPQRETITGVKWVELHSGVKMEIQLDGKNGFLAGNQDRKLQPTELTIDGKKIPLDGKGGKSAQPAELTIRTPGKFRYEIHKDHDLARFDAETVGVGQTPNAPPQVTVNRHNLVEKKNDQLVCQQLTLRLKRKDAGADGKKDKPPPKDAGTGEGVDIESAHAVSTGKGRHVILTSDTDGLHAEGNDFFYDAVKQLTVLKANDGPVFVTYRDDTKIQAAELEIQDVKPPAPPGWKPGQPLPPSARPYQTVKAKGPGWVELVEKGDGKGGKRVVRAEWSKLLTSERDGVEDLLTLTGDARFIDEQAQQTLKADVLRVWLDAPEEVKSQPAAGVSGSRKPRRVDAVGHVVARSKDMNIHDTSRLVVRFVDVPATKHLPPGATYPPPKADKRPAAVAPGKGEEIKPRQPQALPKGPAAPAAKTVSRPGAVGPILGKPDEQGNQKPFDLSARYVETTIERSPVKSVIDVLVCDGQVKVKQEPNKAEEKGTDIAGDKLKMTAGGDGAYHLTVTGDLAELSTDKIYICGPEVNIDQTNNKAWVIGDGAMQMESETNFQGEKLTRPVPMTVHWDKSMLFNGTTAEFTGNIQATQQNARLASQHLLATFDRLVSLKQGNRADQPARVKKMVCDKEVRVEDVVKDPKDDRKIIKYTALQAPVMHMDALEPDDDRPGVKAKGGNKVTASGPGTFRAWEPGNSAADPAGKAGAPKAKPAEVEMKMTYVGFERRMDANSQTNMATFWGKVQVLNLPWPRHDKAVNLEQILIAELPEGALYLRCDNQLKVLDRPADNRPNKEMEGHGNVYVQGKDFHAYAQSVYYNQQKQQVILIGTKESPAVMHRVTGSGGKPETAAGTKIIHNRATGKTNVEGATQIQGEMTPKR